MTWLHTCPSCGRMSQRHSSSAHRPTCRHEYHAPEDCGICGDCRNNYIAPTQPWPKLATVLARREGSG
jgi:hypothetical protein